MIETKSAARAITLATMFGHEAMDDDRARWGRKIQKSQVNSNVGMIAHGVHAGEILAEVERQREPVRSWLYAAYAEPAWEWVSYDMLQHLHETLKAEFRGKGGGNISEQREAALLRCVLNDKRRSLNNAAHAMRPSDYTQEIGIPKESWSRHYRRLARIAGESVDDWDKEGRSAIAIILRKNNGEGVDYQGLECESGT